MSDKPLNAALLGPVTGEEPVFFGHPVLDGLVGTVTALAGELYVVRDRVRILEALLVRSGAIAADAAETYQDDKDAEAARLAALRHYVDRVLGDLVPRTRPDSSIAEGVTRLALQDPDLRLK